VAEKLIPEDLLNIRSRLLILFVLSVDTPRFHSTKVGHAGHLDQGRGFFPLHTVLRGDGLVVLLLPSPLSSFITIPVGKSQDKAEPVDILSVFKRKARLGHRNLVNKQEIGESRLCSIVGYLFDSPPVPVLIFLMNPLFRWVSIMALVSGLRKTLRLGPVSPNESSYAVLNSAMILATCPVRSQVRKSFVRAKPAYPPR
jgi:hypothetical protein